MWFFTAHNNGVQDMASAVKNSVTKAVSKATSAAQSDDDLDVGDAIVDPRDTAKYLLQVTAGSSYDASKYGVVQVNGQAFEIDNEHMTARVRVRIQDYHGLPRSSPSTHAYFSDPAHSKDRYSISFSFVPKTAIPGAEVVMGYDFDRPIRDRLPPGFRPALKFVTTMIDPGIYTEPYADKPYLYGPGLSSFHRFRIGEKKRRKKKEGSGVEEAAGGGDRPATSSSSSSGKSKQEEQIVDEPPDVIEEGADGSGAAVREQLGIPEREEKRRKHFLKQENLDGFAFEAGREYSADFFNPYLDFANFALRLPIFSISVARYIDEKTHTLRYVVKNRRTEEVYFAVVFTLLFGNQLAEALKPEKNVDPAPSSEPAS